MSFEPECYYTDGHRLLLVLDVQQGNVVVENARTGLVEDASIAALQSRSWAFVARCESARLQEIGEQWTAAYRALRARDRREGIAA